MTQTPAPGLWTLSAADPAFPDLASRRLIPLAFIIGGNLVPLIGVLLWGWDVFSIFVLYWLENIVIGLFMIARILFSGLKNAATFAAKIPLALFFTFHYGLFMLGHGVFVFTLFGPPGFDADAAIPALLGAVNSSEIKGLWVALAGIALAELFQVFTAPPAAQGKDGKDTMAFLAAPYGRLFVLHITLIFGGMLTMSLGSPVWALALLIGLKTAFELGVFAWRRSGPFPFKHPDDKQTL